VRPEMHKFWDEVAVLKEDRVNDILMGRGYIEIVAHGVTYRSVVEPMHELVTWICWEPFHVIDHFSYLEDPDATIEWKETE